MFPVFDLPPVIDTPPAYVRKADGLLVPDRKLIKPSYEAMLPGLIPGAGFFGSQGPVADPFEVTFSDKYVSTTAGGTHSFSGVQFGTDSSSRELLISVHVYDNSAVRSVSSVTVGGVGATAVINRNGSSWSYGAHFYKVKVPGQTSGSVSVVLSGSASACAIGVHICRGHSAINAGVSAINTGANASSIALNTNVTAGQIVVGAYSTAYLAGAPAANWTNLTEMFDLSVGTGRCASTAKHLATVTEAPRSISVAPTATCYKAGCTCVVVP